jgi:hypothetical protein
LGANPADNSHESPRRLPSLEDVTKAGATLTVSLYVIGLLLINGYLFQLGVTDFSLIRVRFIYTGALFVAFVLLTSLPTFVLLQVVGGELVRRAPERIEREAPAMMLLALRVSLMMLITPAFFSWALISTSESASPLREVVLAVVISIAGVALGFILYMAWGGLFLRMLPAMISERTSNGGPSDPLKEGRALLFYGQVLVSLFWLLMFSTLFMGLIYPLIPDQFGGGEPKPVQLLIDNEAIAGVKDLGLNLRTKEGLSEPINLLYEGSQVYILRTNERVIIQVKKELVSGMIVRRDLSTTTLAARYGR